MDTQTADVIWHNDGHSLWLSIEKAELQILEVSCPDTEDAECKSKQGCVVQWFVKLYGLDCNIGTCAPEEHIEICWSLVGDPDMLDIAQLWFVPVKDEVFYAWMTSRA
jgi:hypothetical protein